jgi:ABC-2 type transport system permease protein
MNKVGVIKLGVLRGGLEFKQFLRSKEVVFFSMLFPVMLLFIFGSIFQKNLAPGVSFAQYFIAGMIASGMVNTGFQNLAILIPMERDFGTLKRLRGTPLSPVSYFIGKAIVVALSMLLQVAILVAMGWAFFHLHMPHSPALWLRLFVILLLGSACATVLGIAISTLPKSGRGASAVITPIVIILQFFSGVFFVFTQLPHWMQQFASLFPLRWLTEGIRSVFLPDAFKSQELKHSWETGKMFTVLIAWTVVGTILAVRSFKWSEK